MKPILDLAELLKAQYALQKRMGFPTGLGEAGVKENLLHVMVEAVEAMREVNFKPWKTENKAVNRQALATELTDILQFWANAALSVELTPEELTAALRAKWQVNYQRINDHEVKSKKCIEHDFKPTENFLIDRCIMCGEERA